jgi:phosphoribosylanthranilate isomerase
VKICCIASMDEAWLAIRYGASAVGLVAFMPSGPGVIPDEAAAEIAARVPPPVSSFLLTSRQDPEAIIDQQRACRSSAIQICDSLPAGAYDRLREELPGISIVQVIHVLGPESVEEASSIAPHVDALLLDSGNPLLPVKELGGTGRTHDWRLSRAIREMVNVPVFLAGGLNPGNVAEAIEQVGPFGLDVCSGIRREGKLNEGLLAGFFHAIDAHCRRRDPGAAAGVA